MEVVSQQAKREGICNWLDVFPIQIHEMGVVALLDENILAIIAAIVDVVIGVVEERGRTTHFCTIPCSM